MAKRCKKASKLQGVLHHSEWHPYILYIYISYKNVDSRSIFRCRSLTPQRCAGHSVSHVCDHQGVLPPHHSHLGQTYHRPVGIPASHSNSPFSNKHPSWSQETTSITGNTRVHQGVDSNTDLYWELKNSISHVGRTCSGPQKIDLAHPGTNQASLRSFTLWAHQETLHCLAMDSWCIPIAQQTQLNATCSQVSLSIAHDRW